MNKNIFAAVIVTYNLIADLKLCIDAVKKQSMPCDIIVVNNGSTDGTEEYLDTISNEVKVIHQNNMGGAGGFYAGSKYAYNNRYEWIWMMDDDGIPANNQLEQLLITATRNSLYVLNALVVNKYDHTRLAFGRQEPLSTLDLNHEIVKQPLSPFNGTFIHRTIIDKVGFIKKEMFIWGDEQEYMGRIRKAGITPYTATNAIHYHPKEKGVKQYAIPFLQKGLVIEKPIKLSHYFYRNLGYICWHYRNKTVTMKNIAYYTIFLIRKGRIKELIKFYKYFAYGIINKFE